MANDNNFSRLAEGIKTQLFRDAERLGPALMGSNQPDSHRIDRDQYLEFVRRSWTDPQYRLDLLQRVGPKNFLKTAREAWKEEIARWNEQNPPRPRVLMGMGEAQAMMGVPPAPSPLPPMPYGEGMPQMPMGLPPGMPMGGGPMPMPAMNFQPPQGGM